MVCYTGIGSRETPVMFLNQMEMLGNVLWKNKRAILRSGGAEGADTAFERGALTAGATKQIYLPWDGFKKRKHNPEQGYYDVSQFENYDKAVEIAKEFHPAWKRLRDSAKSLHTRNVYQVLGQDLETNSEFIICWTKDGEDTGGTGQAIRIARHFEIEVFNLFNIQHQLKVQEFMLSVEDNNES